MVRYGRTRVVYAPDVQGPVDDQAAEELAALTVKVDPESVERGLRNLVFLAKVARLVVSHHTLRDSEWRARLAEKGAESVLTYTELAGVEEKLLEARRRELYRQNPPPPAFEKWLRSGAKTPPPL